MLASVLWYCVSYSSLLQTSHAHSNIVAEHMAHSNYRLRHIMIGSIECKMMGLDKPSIDFDTEDFLSLRWSDIGSVVGFLYLCIRDN